MTTSTPSSENFDLSTPLGVVSTTVYLYSLALAEAGLSVPAIIKLQEGVQTKMMLAMAGVVQLKRPTVN